jgi:transposase-like protein
MPKRGPRFTQEKKLAIVKEGEKNGVNAVCAKYGISDQSYRLWRYKANGTEPWSDAYQKTALFPRKAQNPRRRLRRPRDSSHDLFPLEKAVWFLRISTSWQAKTIDQGRDERNN